LGEHEVFAVGGNMKCSHSEHEVFSLSLKREEFFAREKG
jgi:hypothetical protein